MMPISECAEDQFNCSSGGCGWKCNNNPECPDGSDEIGCGESLVPLTCIRYPSIFILYFIYVEKPATFKGHDYFRCRGKVELVMLKNNVIFRM